MISQQRLQELFDYSNGNLCAKYGYQPKLTIGKKRKAIGYFEDIEFAELVAIEARNKFHGTFARG